VAQLMFKQLQAQRADRDLLAREVAQLKRALRRRNTVVPSFLDPTETDGVEDKCVGTDAALSAEKSVQANLEIPDTAEITALRVRGVV